MRIVHVTQPTQAGVAAVVASLAVHQAGCGHDVTVLCPTSEVSDGPLARLQRHARVRLVNWTATRSPGPSSLTEAFHLRRLLRATGADLVVLHSAKAGLAGRLAIRGHIPTVFVPHAWSFEAVAGPVRALTLRWERLAQRWTETTVCVSSDELERATTAGLSTDGMTVINNGVDLDRFTPAPQHEARTALGLAPVPTVVCVGRLTRQKGQDRLLSAWPAVRRAVPVAELVLVGDGPDRQVLEQHQVEGVRFIGATSDPRPYFQAADVVAMASRWEAGALVPLEAMATARSVVSVDVTGVRGVLADTGTVVAAGDDAQSIQLLADALADRLLDLPGTAAMGQRARLHAQSDLSLERTLSDWDELLTGAGR